MKKKAVSLLFLFLLLICCFCSCGSTTAGKTDTEPTKDIPTNTLKPTSKSEKTLTVTPEVILTPEVVLTPKPTETPTPALTFTPEPTSKPIENPEGKVEIIAEYTLSDCIGWYTRHFMVIKNNSN